MAQGVLWSRRANLAKWTFLKQYTLSVKLFPLRRDGCKCHCPRGAHIFTQQEGPAIGSGSDLGGHDLSVSCLCSFMPSLLDCVFLSLSSFSISYCSPSLPLPLPFLLLPCALFSFILTSHSALLCPCYHGYCLLRMRWEGDRTDGRYRGLWCSCHLSLSFSHPS